MAHQESPAYVPYATVCLIESYGDLYKEVFIQTDYNQLDTGNSFPVGLTNTVRDHNHHGSRGSGANLLHEQYSAKHGDVYHDH